MQASGVDPITAEVLRSSIHELKGPANRLRLLTQLLGRSSACLDQDARKLLEHISDSAASVEKVAEGLRNYFEICTRPLCRQPLELNLPLESALANVAAEMAAAGAQFTHSALPAVSADGFLISWVFEELLTNALRARSGSGVHIHVGSVSHGSGEAYISVSDDGPGIDSSMAERIFRPFEKLGSGAGAGLGLTICRKIMEMHGGRIWAEDRAGGAEFRFFIGGAPAA